MTNSELKVQELVWTEYQYRHEHIWSTIYKLTFTVAFLEVLPYIRAKLAVTMEHVMLLPCLLGLLLALLGWIMISRELQVFAVVKKLHRNNQKTTDALGEGYFETVVNTYLMILLSAALLNTIWVDLCWL